MKTRNNIGIQNAVACVSKFDRSIKLKLARFGAGKFGHVCEQTGKRLFIEYPTRLDAAVGIASRYFTCQSHADCAFVNPKSVATFAGLEMAFDLLLSCGFVKIEGKGSDRKAVIIENKDIAKNQ